MEGHIELPPLGQSEFTLLWAVLASAFIALAYGWYLVRSVLSEDPGTEKMQEIARAIEEGAMAYLGRQVRTMIWFVILITIGLYLMYESLPEQYPHPLPIGVAVAFLMGVMASYGAGYVGMWLAVRGNVRAANAALKGFKPALELAFRAGTVSGMFTVGFGLLGATLIFMIFREEAMKVLIGFGFGGSLAALFMRVGGGIFTKAADVGADLVGKVEHNLRTTHVTRP
jgi:K(+)-stimulated pyrophosphate-energized sodium pump